MFPSSSPSSSMGINGGLLRFSSAPGSLLATAVDELSAPPFAVAPLPNTASPSSSFARNKPNATAPSSSSLSSAFASSGSSLPRPNHLPLHNHTNDASSARMRSWDDTHPVIFPVALSTEAKTTNSSEIQFQFNLSQSATEMMSLEKLVNVPNDSVPCKIRAKRGCATHPRSIAERDRRTRISGKLKKLHDLVPNMDKQTSYADMLDLAVQHIKGLQNKVQKLNSELESCTCGCRLTTDP